MSGLGDLVQKAFYLGVGAASMAAEKAGSTLQEIREQAQKLGDDMVQKGEMSTEEARKFVNDMVQQAQQQTMKAATTTTPEKPKEPRQIEILDEDEQPGQKDVEALRQEMAALQQELERLRNQ